MFATVRASSCFKRFCFPAWHGSVFRVKNCGCVLPGVAAPALSTCFCLSSAPPNAPNPPPGGAQRLKRMPQPQNFEPKHWAPKTKSAPRPTPSIQMLLHACRLAGFGSALRVWGSDLYLSLWPPSLIQALCHKSRPKPYIANLISQSLF